MKAKDYYEILGITKEGFEEGKLKKAYQKAALKVHPDKNRAPQATEAFKKVSQAYTCLSDPTKKRYYDQTGHEDPQAAAAAERT